jgi:hypothetical protein
MSIQLRVKDATDVSGCTIVRHAPSRRGRGKRVMSAKHKGRTLPVAVGECTYEADCINRRRK